MVLLVNALLPCWVEAAARARDQSSCSLGAVMQVPVIQLLLGQTGIVTSEQMLAVWKYVVVGAVIAAAVLTPSTDPLTQCLLAGPLIGLYMGGAYMVKILEAGSTQES